MTADVYTGKHRREGALGRPSPGHPGPVARLEQGWPPAGGAGRGDRQGAVSRPGEDQAHAAVHAREAAELAAASLSDTLAAVAETTVARRVLALDGTPGRWLPQGFDVIGQRGAGLDERIAWALADARVTLPLPVVLIGMDTPQVTPELLAAAAEPLVSRTADATFGMAEDGGFWLLGLREVDPDLILGVPMSQPDTGPKQLARLEQAGLRDHDAARAHRRGHGPRGRTHRRPDAGIALRGLHGPAA